jgi:hypothetical protein
MSSLLQTQIEWNEKSCDKWDLYHSHREQVMALIEGKSKSQNDRLCILGAGNCNDIDLNVLVDRYREIHLIDIDDKAVCEGVSRQELNDCKRIFILEK